MSAETTKKATSDDLEMRSEYRFDYDQSRPNRFASQFESGSVAVVLAPDVAAVFSTSESVNSLLRSVIKALPDKPKDASQDP